MARRLLPTSALLAALCAGCPPTLDRPPPTDDVRYPPPTDSAASDVPGWILGEGGAADAAGAILDGPQPDAPQPDLSSGSWVQADSKNCLDHCTTLGKVNVPSPEGAHCMSGEVRPPSGINQGIIFTYGCWPDCLPQGPTIVSASVGVYCYRNGQKQDNDPSDLTVGCFCH